jgi:hypothetical protein
MEKGLAWMREWLEHAREKLYGKADGAVGAVGAIGEGMEDDGGLDPAGAFAAAKKLTCATSTGVGGFGVSDYGVAVEGKYGDVGDGGNEADFSGDESEEE